MWVGKRRCPFFQVINPLQKVSKDKLRVYCANRIVCLFSGRRDKRRSFMILIDFTWWVRSISIWWLCLVKIFGRLVYSASAAEPGRSSFLFPSFMCTIETSFLYTGLSRVDWASTNLLTFAPPFIIIRKKKTDFPRSVFFNLCTRSIRGITVYMWYQGKLFVCSREAHQVSSGSRHVNRSDQKFCSSNLISKSGCM